MSIYIWGLNAAERKERNAVPASLALSALLVEYTSTVFPSAIRVGVVANPLEDM